MKTTIRTALVAAALLAGTAAIAQTTRYEDIVREQGFCADIGKLSRISYTMRTQGADRAAKLQQLQESGLLNRGKDSIAYRFAFEYGFDQATDERDAYMSAWARCQDLAR